MKPSYKIINNIGNAKYTINFHDGEMSHRDGSPFFDMRIFKNKQKLNAFEKDLLEKGFVEI